MGLLKTLRTELSYDLTTLLLLVSTLDLPNINLTFLYISRPVLPLGLDTKLQRTLTKANIKETALIQRDKAPNKRSHEDPQSGNDHLKICPMSSQRNGNQSYGETLPG